MLCCASLVRLPDLSITVVVEFGSSLRRSNVPSLLIYLGYGKIAYD